MSDICRRTTAEVAHSEGSSSVIESQANSQRIIHVLDTIEKINKRKRKLIKGDRKNKKKNNNENNDKDTIHTEHIDLDTIKYYNNNIK